MKTEIGHITKVRNLRRRFGADPTYFVGWIKIDETETPVAFTDDDLDVAEVRARRNEEDMPAIRRWSCFDLFVLVSLLLIVTLLSLSM